MEPLILTILLLVMMVLFITEVFPAEISALMIVFSLVLLTLSGVGRFLTPDQAISGLANPAVITIAAMLVISEAQVRTGVVSYIGDRISEISNGNPTKVMVYSLVAVALFSSFINNTPVVALYIPLMLRICYRYELSPSKYLIPVSYASILGGTSTLIGTSTNIIIAGVAADISRKNPEYGIANFTMFTITPLGIVIALSGLAIILLVGRKILPERKAVTASFADMGKKRFMTELKILEGCPAVGKKVKTVFGEKYSDVTPVKVERGGEFIEENVEDHYISAGDIILVEGTASRIASIQRNEHMILTPDLGEDLESLAHADSKLAEMVLLPGSRYAGMTIEEIQFESDYGINVVAILSAGEHTHVKSKIRKFELDVGDTLLVQGDQDSIARLNQEHNLLLLEGVGERVKNIRKAPIAVTTIIAVVTLAAVGIMPIMVSASVGAIFLVATKTVPIERAYKSVDIDILVLIASTISLGTALEQTGTARLYGEFLVDSVSFLGPVAMLGAIFFITAFFTTFMSNNAVAVPMTYIAVATAVGFNYQPMPFIMAALFGASACYASPIGYQTNLFAYGPGGYKFSDYFRLGLPLNLMTMILAMVLIPVFWPLKPL